MWFESKDQLPTPRSVDWKPATKEATPLLLRLDVPSTLLDVPPCWEEWVHSPTHLPTHKGSLFDSVIVWAFAEEFEQWKKIKYVLQSHCLREWNLGVRSTLYLHAFGGGAVSLILRLKRTWSQWPVLTFTTGLKFQVATVVTTPWKLDPDTHWEI